MPIHRCNVILKSSPSALQQMKAESMQKLVSFETLCLTLELNTCMSTNKQWTKKIDAKNAWPMYIVPLSLAALLRFSNKFK